MAAFVRSTEVENDGREMLGIALETSWRLL